MSAPDSRLATEHIPDMTAFSDERSQKMAEKFKQLGSDIEMADLGYHGDRRNVIDYLGTRGWEVSTFSTRDAHAANGFEFPDEMSAIFANLRYVSAVLRG